MRKFHDASDIFSSFTGGNKSSTPQIVTPAVDASADSAAREEANRKARAAAAARSGSRDTLLSPLGGAANGLATAQRTLLGGG